MNHLTEITASRIARLAEACHRARTAPMFDLQQAIRCLSGPERAELRALMWLGRGDAGETAEHWPEMVADAAAQSAADGPAADAAYLGGKTRLAEYLRAELARLVGGSGDDADAGPVRPTPELEPGRQYWT